MDFTQEQWLVSQGIGVGFSILLLWIVWRLVSHTMKAIDKLTDAITNLNANVAILLDRAGRVTEKSIDVVSMAAHAAEHMQTDKE